MSTSLTSGKLSADLMARRMPDWPISKHYGNPEVCSVGLPALSRLPGGEDVVAAGGESVREDSMRESSGDADEVPDP